MSAFGIPRNERGLSARPERTRDAEFEEVALRLAQAGALREHVFLWRGRLTFTEEFHDVDAAIRAVEKILGREVRVFVGPILYDEAAPWWQAAQQDFRESFL